MSNRDLEVMADARLQAQVVALRKHCADMAVVLATVLNQVDFTSAAYMINDKVRVVLDKRVIEMARAALARWEEME